MSNLLPNLIIGGVHKAGTTSIFNYLSCHTNICASSKKEIHYFTPLRYNKKLSPISEYEKYFIHHRNEKYKLEASPSYLFGGEKIATVIKRKLGDAKIIFILRCPIQRFLSYYLHLKATMVINDVSFDQFLNKAIHESEKEDVDNYYRRAIREGKYAPYLETWLKLFGNSVKVIFFDNLVQNPRMQLNILCKWLEIDPEIYDSFKFGVNNRTLDFKNRVLHRIAMKINRKLETFFLKNQRLKRVIRYIYNRINSSEFEKDIPEDAFSILSSIYTPYNKNLRDLLLKYGYNNFPDWITDGYK